MLGDVLCASEERIESRERSTDDVVDDAYYRHPKQEGGNPPFVVSSQGCQLPPIPFSSATVVVVSMEMCVQNLYPQRSPELPGNSRKALVELRATKERLRCESFPIPRCLLPDSKLEEEATEEGNFGVRVDVCPSDKSNEIHYNRGSFFSLKPIPMKTGATRDPHWHSRLTAVLQFSPQRSASFNNNSNRHLAILTSIRLSCNYDPTDHLVEKVSTRERSVSNGFYWSKVNEANCGSSFSIILANGRSNFRIG
ncbi:hypothetical protein ALC57_09598 [Trachymyrmex cornetzi]|uniref:Uncharacterized protein n=1 Tax=Trachymyrmex cornetzi TaxID=471704 RepID=A0A195DYW9_9HYME|nr:hypothetical protein ALC57_09598 [Trachymyrmex cornetzi]